MINEDNLQFDLEESTMFVKLTPIGEEIIGRLDPNGEYQKNSEGYYLIFSSQLFTLYRSLLMRKSNASISDLVDGPILIDSVYLTKQDGSSIRQR